jgi:hypothetical protein
MIGGFASWKAAGLPVRPPAEQESNGLPGMGDPEPVIDAADERDRQIDVDAS